MSEQGKTTGTARNQGIILIIIGIIIFIAGICIATIHSPLRGSGLGTVFIIIGIIFAAIGIIRSRSKSK
jgi:uncharacterized membrane protein